MLVINTDIEQGSPEWHNAREARVGGSTCAPLFTEPPAKARDAGEVLGKGAVSLAYDIAARRVKLDQPITASPYYDLRPMSEAMEMGQLREPFARNAYQLKTGFKVDEVGYVTDTRYEFIGFSPDGFVGSDGMIEIKCPMGKEFARVRHTLKIKHEYMCQMNFGLWLTGRDWCDHFTFHPDSPVQSLIRVERDPAVMARLDVAIPAFNDLVIEIISSLLAGE